MQNVEARCRWATPSFHVLVQFEEEILVELRGIEPRSFGVEPDILRVQSVMSFSQPRRSHRHVTDRLSQDEVPLTPPDRE